MSAGRPIEFDPEQVLDAAVALFRERGYTATSVADLLQARGLSRSSLYHSFGDKQTLFTRCLDRYRSQVAQQMQSALEDAPSARGWLETVFREPAEQAGDPTAMHGCLVMNSASELGQSNAEVAAHVGSGVDHLRRVFATAVERARQAGEIPAEKDSRTLAAYLLCSMAGLRTLLKAGATRREARGIVDTVLSALD